MLIRAATPADVPAILPMVAALCSLHQSWDPQKYAFLPDILERYRRWLPQRAADPRSILLVAELPIPTGTRTQPVLPSAPPLAGFLVASIEPEIPIYQITEFGFIHDVWVEPRHRSQGIARHLVDAAIARFSEMGLTQVRLDTAARNESARRLFASYGFRPSTTEMLRVLPTAP